MIAWALADTTRQVIDLIRAVAPSRMFVARDGPVSYRRLQRDLDAIFEEILGSWQQDYANDRIHQGICAKSSASSDAQTFPLGLDHWTTNFDTA